MPARASALGGFVEHFALGEKTAASGDLHGAAEHFVRAIRLKPNFITARLNHGRTLVHLARFAEARAAYSALLNRDPDHIDARRELCWLQARIGDFQGMLANVNELYARGQDVIRELDQVVMGLMHICDWSNRKVLQARILEHFESGQPCIVNVMTILASVDKPRVHLCMAKCISASVRNAIKDVSLLRSAMSDSKTPGTRTRIGYIGGTLGNHVISVLLAGVMENHRRDQFHTFAYDYTQEDGSPLRARMKAAF